MFNQPNFPNPAKMLEADDYCEHYDFCQKFNITTSDCKPGANLVRRCKQGEFAIIKLLSALVDLQSSHKEHQQTQES